MKKVALRSLVLALLVVFVAIALIACGGDTAPAGDGDAAGDAAKKAPYDGLLPADREYYLASSHNAHNYFADSHLGLRYAAEYFNVKIVAVGPDAWDTAAQAEAFEQAIAKQPAGIITRGYDDASVAATQKATSMGIPVICTESHTPEMGGALCYIGLDNYQCGRDTTVEFVKQAGESGKVALMGNWGASNTDDKVRGVKDEFAENYPGWQIVAEVDDKATSDDAIDAAKNIINNYPDVNGIIGLDSSSGTGIALAMQELNIEAGKYKVVVHDREAQTIEYIQKGYISSTLINLTAAQEFWAVLIMEDWNNGGIKNIPVSSNNEEAGVVCVPEYMYMTAFVINKDNVDYFVRENLPTYETDKYNK